MASEGAAPPSRLVVWQALLAGSLALRPLLPIDETRYISVAWEMWQRGDFLVPHLNGLPYSHKPPILFWLIHLGWAAFGVNEWWPRLVPALASLASLALVERLARRLWGPGSSLERTAPLLLLTTLLWSFVGTLLTFDMLIGSFCLLTLLGWLQAAQGGGLRAWGLAALGIGLGILAKGPVLLVFVLPPALLAPWWAAAKPAEGWGRWYLGVSAAFAGGVAIALAWALPAAQAGGPDYAAAIFLRQTTDRLVQASAHPAPWWWYLPVLPAALLPWSAWPALWRPLLRLRLADRPVRFLLAWLAPAFLLLCLISSKQPHYLIGLLPAAALLLALAAAGVAPRVPWSSLRLPFGLVAGLGALLALVPLAARLGKLPVWARDVGPGIGLLLVALGLVPFFRRGEVAPLRALAGLSLATFLAIHLGVAAAASGYEVRPMALYLAACERQGWPLAHRGAYHGQFHFAGRLERPIAVLDKDAAAAWLQANPAGRLIGDYQGSPPSELGTPLFAMPFRGRWLAVWGDEATPAPADLERAGDGTP